MRDKSVILFRTFSILTSLQRDRTNSDLSVRLSYDKLINIVNLYVVNVVVNLCYLWTGLLQRN